MRVLITGAAGFVGRHLAEHLMAGGHDVVGVGHATDQQLAHDYVAVDLRDHEAARATFATVDPEWVFHLAAEASVARQIAEAEGDGRDRVTVKTGELEARRDFTDVRDVVRAYVLLLEHGAPGAYNVCSGSSRSAADILAALSGESPLVVESEVDP